MGNKKWTVGALLQERQAADARSSRCLWCCFRSHCRILSCSRSRCGCLSHPATVRLFRCYCCLYRAKPEEHHVQGVFHSFSNLCKNVCILFIKKNNIKILSMNCHFFCLWNYLPCDVFREAFLAESCSPSLSSLLLNFRSSSNILTWSTTNSNLASSWNTKICFRIPITNLKISGEVVKRDEALTLAGHHRFWAGGCLSSWKNFLALQKKNTECISSTSIQISVSE